MDSYFHTPPPPPHLKRLSETTVNNGVVWDILSDLDSKLGDQKAVLAKLFEIQPLWVSNEMNKNTVRQQLDLLRRLRSNYKKIYNYQRKKAEWREKEFV